MLSIFPNNVLASYGGRSAVSLVRANVRNGSAYDWELGQIVRWLYTLVSTSFKIRSRLTYDLSVETNSLRTSEIADELVSARFRAVRGWGRVRTIA